MIVVNLYMYGNLDTCTLMETILYVILLVKGDVNICLLKIPVTIITGKLVR